MNLLLPILIILAIYMSFKDYKILKRHKSYKKYATLIDPVYKNNTSTFLKTVDSYIAEEKMVEFKNKARVLKLFSILKENKGGYQEVLDELDLKEILLDKSGKINKTKKLLNSDCFFWLLLSLIECDIHHNIDAVSAIESYLNQYDSALNRQLYYQMIKSYISLIKGDNDSLKLYHRILDGDYFEFDYAKDLIGIFKRLSATILVYKGEELSSEDEDLVYVFAKGQAGQFVLKELRMYEKYKNDNNED